jgi:uncharacterized protein YdeI (YjbR/CyaY-like superfamily)
MKKGAAKIEAGLMTQAGLVKVEAANKDGSWNMLDATQNKQILQDLIDALSSSQKAHDNVMAFNDSSKKMIAAWIEDAKRPETRKRRIDKVVSRAAENKKTVSLESFKA